MPKKAGPKRLDPDTFRPVLLKNVDGEEMALVCSKRACIYQPIVGSKEEGSRSAEAFHYITGIAYTPAPVILRPLTIDQGTWKRYPPQSLALSYRGAQVALAEVWHGVDTSVDWDTMTMHATYKPTLVTYKGGVRIRNTIAALHWNVWDILNYSLEERARILTSQGHKCTASQLARFAEDRGLPVSCMTP